MKYNRKRTPIDMIEEGIDVVVMFFGYLYELFLEVWDIAIIAIGFFLVGFMLGIHYALLQ